MAKLRIIIDFSDNGSKQQDERILRAKRDFQKIQEEIEPFIKHKKFKVISTAGKWRRGI